MSESNFSGGPICPHLEFPFEVVPSSATKNKYSCMNLNLFASKLSMNFKQHSPKGHCRKIFATAVFEFVSNLLNFLDWKVKK
jgi:hypothetical protein